MGLTSDKLMIKNPCKPELQAMEVDALLDFGSVFLCIPALVQLQLGLEEVAKRDVMLADGSRKLVPYVGPVELHFMNRAGFVGAIVIGDQVILGAIPMGEMDLAVMPRSATVDMNSARPNLAHGIVK